MLNAKENDNVGKGNRKSEGQNKTFKLGFRKSIIEKILFV